MWMRPSPTRWFGLRNIELDGSEKKIDPHPPFPNPRCFSSRCTPKKNLAGFEGVQKPRCTPQREAPRGPGSEGMIHHILGLVD